MLPYRTYYRVVRTYKLRTEGWGRSWVENRGISMSRRESVPGRKKSVE